MKCSKLFGAYVGAILLSRICNRPTLAGEKLLLSEFSAEESPAGSVICTPLLLVEISDCKQIVVIRMISDAAVAHETSSHGWRLLGQDKLPVHSTPVLKKLSAFRSRRG